MCIQSSCTTVRNYDTIKRVMNMDREKGLPKRKPLRMKSYDYSTSGAYFLTICTENRRCMLSRIVGDDVLGVPNNAQLLPYGKIADKCINRLNEFYDNIIVDSYVIMPNHIHIMLFVAGTETSAASSSTRQTAAVSNFVSTFKRFCNKEYGENIWQRGFYDHIVRGREDYEEISKYIHENPARWYCDNLYKEGIQM